MSLEREVPDTASTMRLSGLELADAIGEVTLLGADLTEVRVPHVRLGLQAMHHACRPCCCGSDELLAWPSRGLLLPHTDEQGTRSACVACSAESMVPLCQLRHQ